MVTAENKVLITIPLSSEEIKDLYEGKDVDKKRVMPMFGQNIPNNLIVYIYNKEKHIGVKNGPLSTESDAVTNREAQH